MKFSEFTLAKIVAGFTAFYKKSDEIFRGWSDANPDNHLGAKYNRGV